MYMGFIDDIAKGLIGGNSGTGTPGSAPGGSPTTISPTFQQSFTPQASPVISPIINSPNSSTVGAPSQIAPGGQRAAGGSTIPSGGPPLSLPGLSAQPGGVFQQQRPFNISDYAPYGQSPSEIVKSTRPPLLESLLPWLIIGGLGVAALAIYVDKKGGK